MQKSQSLFCFVFFFFLIAFKDIEISEAFQSVVLSEGILQMFEFLDLKAAKIITRNGGVVAQRSKKKSQVRVSQMLN